MENFTAAQLLGFTNGNEKTISLGAKGRSRITEEVRALILKSLRLMTNYQAVI